MRSSSSHSPCHGMGHCSTIVSDGLTRQLYSNLNQYEWERERALVVGPKYYSKFSFVAYKKNEFKCLLFLFYNKLDLSVCHKKKKYMNLCCCIAKKFQSFSICSYFTGTWIVSSETFRNY